MTQPADERTGREWIEKYDKARACAKCGMVGTKDTYDAIDDLIRRVCSNCVHEWSERPLEETPSPSMEDLAARARLIDRLNEARQSHGLPPITAELPVREQLAKPAEAS